MNGANMLKHLNEKNDVEIFGVKDPCFASYGRVVEGIDCTELLSFMQMHTSIPEDGNVYVASVPEMEAIQALKNLDAATARACQAEYEEYEEAAQLALSGIDNVDKPIVDAYQVKIEDYAARYEAARAEVALSDEYLRDFLGQASK